jgi:ribokinase
MIEKNPDQKDFDVIGFGALNFDRLYLVDEIPSAGDEIVIRDIDEAPGGSAANTIIGLSRLGLRTGFIGTISFDTEGNLIHKDFEDHKVDTQGISITSAGKTGSVIGYVDTGGQRALGVYPGVNSNLRIGRINVEYAKKARWIHMSSFVDNEQTQEQTELIETLRKEDAEMGFSLSPGMIYARKKLEKLGPLVSSSSILFLTEKEIETMTGLGYKDACKALIDEGVKIVAVTRDSNGCYIANGQEEILSPAYEVHDVIDTTGAGDAFAAGFLYGHLKGKPLKRCAEYGNWLASRCITKLGARRGLAYSINGFRNHIQSRNRSEPDYEKTVES